MITRVLMSIPHLWGPLLTRFDIHRQSSCQTKNQNASSFIVYTCFTQITCLFYVPFSFLNPTLQQPKTLSSFQYKANTRPTAASWMPSTFLLSGFCAQKFILAHNNGYLARFVLPALDIFSLLVITIGNKLSK